MEILSTLPVIESIGCAIIELEDPHGWRTWNALCRAWRPFARYSSVSSVKRSTMRAFTRRHAYRDVWCLPNDMMHSINDEPCRLDFTQLWHFNGLLHRENDQPAAIRTGDTKEWWMNGKRHRDNDLPAVIHEDGYKEWWVEGKLHRENDQPAITDIDGYKAWYKDGNLHRDNDRPATINADGNLEWWVDGKLHRDFDQPAIIYRFKKKWYFNGQLHRDNYRPALIELSGTEIYETCYEHGEEVSPDAHDIDCNFVWTVNPGTIDFRKTPCVQQSK